MLHMFQALVATINLSGYTTNIVMFHNMRHTCCIYMLHYSHFISYQFWNKLNKVCCTLLLQAKQIHKWMEWCSCLWNAGAIMGAKHLGCYTVLALAQGSLGSFFASLHWTPEERRASRRKQKRGWGGWRRRQSYDGSKGRGSRFPFPLLLPLTTGSCREEHRTGACSVEGISEGGGYCVRVCRRREAKQ
jgi:hypothetical protein